MGLDMYLEAKCMIRNVKDYEDLLVPLYNKFQSEDETTNDIVNKIPHFGISFEIGYWRKANHIHQWFVTNVQDGVDNCGEYYVSEEKLQELLDTCRAVLKDVTKAPELLPTQAGFFFGGIQYDEDYYSDIENTIKIIQTLFDTESKREGVYPDYYYSSSW